MAMFTPPDNLELLDDLQRNINNVLVQTSKALKLAAKGSRPTPASVSEASSSINSSISSSYHSFNYALDDLEHEINRAKAVLLRDLNELKAKRLTPPPEPKPAAPPAPMDFQMDGSSFDLSSVTPGVTPAQLKPFQSNAPDRPIKQEATPVAPVPNMGLGFPVSPEVAKAPSPALSQAKVKAIKQSPKVSPKLKGAQTARPSGAPIKKEPRTTVSPQLPRTAGPTPPPAHASAPVAPPAPMQAAPMDLPLAPLDAAAALQPEMVFTDMAFSVDDSQGGGQLSGPPQSQQQQDQELDSMLDLTQFAGLEPADSGLGTFTGPGGPPGGDTDNRNGIPSKDNKRNNPFGPDSIAMANAEVDAELDDILNSTEPGSAENLGMDDFNLGGDIGSLGMDESNGFDGSTSFDDMWYADGSGGEAEFGGTDSYYGA